MKMVMNELQNRGIEKQRILHYNFDSLEHEDLKTSKALYTELKPRLSEDKKTYIFLDEIQEVQSWEKVVNSLMTDYDVDIYVTGSNSRMMSSEISTYLTGAICIISHLPAFLFRISDFPQGLYRTVRYPYGACQLSEAGWFPPHFIFRNILLMMLIQL